MNQEGLYQHSNRPHYFLSKNGVAACWTSDTFRNGLHWLKGQGNLSGGSASDLGKNHTLRVPLEYLT